uniref:ArnT family glycosyltransferase n=1 Tax=Herbidospora sakaeratensis TaxID=564415 RepID=UPI0007C75E0B|nr:glycosyltransferase family 39 protein [Herbidospora sakaeratensis]
MSVTEREPETEAAERGAAPVAWWPVGGIAAVTAALLLATVHRYGYSMDELYFVAAGRHPDWGYADQPPFVPLLAALMDGLFPGSLFWLRAPDALVVAAGVVVCALIARELGGRRRAQVMAAAAFAIAFLNHGGQIDTGTFNLVAWTVCIWLVARWVRLHNEGRTGLSADLPLFWAGVATAVALQVKYLIPILWIGIAIGLLVAGPRRMLTRPLLWAGAAFAVLTAVPGLVWQAANGWPQAEMTAVLAEETELMWGGRLAFLPQTLMTMGLAIGTILGCYGLWKLLRSPELRPHRYLGWAALVVIVAVVAANGRFTYVAGVFPLLFAAGAVQLQERRPARWWRWVPTWPVFVLSALLTLLGLPIDEPSEVRPASSPDDRRARFDTLVQFGWPEFTDSVAKVWRTLPSGGAVVTKLYWQAGALEVLGPDRGLPRPYSPHRGYWNFGRPSDGVTTVLYVGGTEESLRRHFGAVRRAGTVEGRIGIAIGTPIWVCERPLQPWSRLWPEMRSLTLR